MPSLGSDDTLTVTDGLKAYLLDDYTQADIGGHNLVILGFVDKLTRAPSTITASYIDELKALGLDDTLLHDIVQVAAYFNYINRLADGLGVELEG